METTIQPKIENIDLSELAGLRSRLSGQALTQGDAGYDTARQAWNFGGRPALRGHGKN